MPSRDVSRETFAVKYPGRTGGVCFIPDRFSGGARLRSIWPAQVMRSRGRDCWVMTGGFDIDARPDLVVLHSALDPRKYLMLRHFIRKGIPVLMQEDDNIFLTPHRHIEINDDQREATKKCATEAAGMIVTTEGLGTFFGRWNGNVSVIENYLPAWCSMPRKVKPERERPLVGYAGAILTHAHDLDVIRDIAPAMLDGCDFEGFGAPGIPEYLGVQGRSIPWTSEPRAYYRTIARWDIGLVPLLDHPFNDCKSWLKIMDYAAAGLAIIASPSPENLKLAEEIGNVKIAHEPEDFVKWVTYFRGDRPAIAYDGGLARLDAARLSLENEITRWETVLDLYL